jgi:uncharacterized protein (DUF58 family)
VSAADGESTLGWTARSYLLFAAAFFLFALAIAGRTPVPLFLAFPLLIAPLGAALLGPHARPRVRSQGRLDGSGRELSLTLQLRTEPPVRPADLLPSVVRPAGVIEVRPSTVSAGPDTLTLRFAWVAPDPIVAIVPPPAARWRDPVGLVERTVTVEGDPVGIERYPPELHRIPSIRLLRTVPLPGETRSRAIGDSGEFFGIREAAPGDPVRRLNFRASARLGRRLVNEYTLDRTGDIVLLLDARPTRLGPVTGGRLLGISRAAAFGLSETFLRAKNRVGVAVYGEFLDATPLSTGRGQRLKIRDLLLRAELSGEAGPSERCAIALRRYYPRGVNTIILSPLADEEGVDLVLHVRRRGFPCVVLSPSALPQQLTLAQLPAEDLALVARIAHLLRRQQVARAWGSAPVVDWEEYWSLGGFVNFLGRPSARDRGVA